MPIIEEYAPNIAIQVDVVGLTERLNVDGQKDGSAPPRPALGTASITLTVPPVPSTSSPIKYHNNGFLRPCVSYVRLRVVSCARHRSPRGSTSR